MPAKLDAVLARIARLNPRLKAYVSLRDADALKSEWLSLKADENSAAAASSSSSSPILVAVKDNYCTTDLPTTCCSNILKDYISPYEAHVVSLLKQSRKALILGKTNMDEFAMGSNNTHTIFGPALNPLFEDKDVSTGGSSGGSAAAVAAGLCDVSLGSDTGGSVRLPSAYCSVVGFKPSYGLISRHGLVSYAQSLDTVGIMAKKVSKVEAVFDILNKYDRNDPTSLRSELREKLSSRPTRSPKVIGILKEAIIDMDKPVLDAWTDVLVKLHEQYGYEIKVVSVPSVKSALPSYFIISPAEAFSNLARYDGVRYGHRAAKDRDGDVLYAPTRTEGFGPEVQRRILLGTYNLSAGAYGNHFEKAQKVRRMIIDEFNAIFRTSNEIVPTTDATTTTITENQSTKVDILIHPTGKTLPPEHPLRETPVESYTNDVLTVPANLAGLPAISVPYGEPGIGLQVWGQYGDDTLVLEVAKQIEQLRGN